MPTQLTPTHRCKFKVNGGWRGGDIILMDAWGALVIDRLTGIPWSLSLDEIEHEQPIEAKRNDEGAVS